MILITITKEMKSKIISIRFFFHNKTAFKIFILFCERKKNIFTSILITNVNVFMDK